MKIIKTQYPRLDLRSRSLLVGTQLGIAALLIPMMLTAQEQAITFDNSFGSVILPVGFGQNGNYQILESYGLKNESNLFHSFGAFGIPTGESATFEVGVDVLNVISRVTGGNPSVIDGWISIDDDGGDGANFWMINPAGLMFGPNTVIDVGGTFNVGAADYLSFSGDLEFSLSDDSVNLLVANPLEFGFLNSSGGGELSLDSVDFTSDDDSFTGISLAGRDVSISNVNIESVADTDAQGEIRIFGENTLTLTNTNFSSLTGGEFNGSNAILQGGIVTLNGSSVVVDTYGSGDSGSVAIAGTQSVNLNSTWITAETFGAGDAGTIQIQGGAVLFNTSSDGVPLEDSEKSLIASTSGYGFSDGSEASFGAAGTVLISGDSIILFNTGIEATTRSDRLENLAGSITIQADGDLMLQSSSLETSTLGSSVAGFILIEAENLVFSDETQIKADTSAAGSAGSIEVLGDLLISNGSSITSDTTGLGNAGSILLVGNVSISNNSEINSDTSDAGNAGLLQLLGDVSISDNSSITSGTTDVGNAGFILIEGSVSIANNSQINSDTAGTGNAGFIALTGGDILLANDAVVAAETSGEGNAGAVRISGGTFRSNTAPDGSLLENALPVLIASTSGLGVNDGFELGFGAAGDVWITGDSIVIANTSIEASTRSDRTEKSLGIITLDADLGDLSVLISTVETSATGMGGAGIIEPRGANIVLGGGTGIEAEASGGGSAGNITIQIEDSLRLVGSKSKPSGITTNALQSKGGNIFIETGGVLSLDDSLVRASAGADGNGGDVVVTVNDLLLQRSGILARAQGGNGGELDLFVSSAGKLFIIDTLSLVNADSDTGSSGRVIINAPDVDLDSGLQEQDANIVATPELAPDACGPAATGSLSTFTVDDEGGTPFSPDRYLSAGAQTEVTPSSANVSQRQYAVADALLASVQINRREDCR